MKSSRNLFPTYIAAIIAVFLWGFSFIWTNILIKENIPIYTFIFIRLSIAGLLLLLSAKITKKLQKIDPADFKWFFAMAFAEPFIYFIGESFGMKATGSPTISAIIIATIPIFCLIYERFISNIHISPLAIFGIIITIPGIIMAASESGASNSIEHLYGIALLFLAVFGAVGFAITTKKLTEKYNNFTIATYQFLIGSILFLPLFIMYGTSGINSSFFTLKVIGPILTLSILCSCLCFVLWIGVIKNLGITRSNTLSALIPAVSAIGAAYLGEESLSTIKWIGIGITIIGVILAQKK